MEEKNITEQESLSIIQSMIEKTKQQLVDRSKFFFLWGFAVLVCAIAQYIMLKMLLVNTQKVWIVMPIIAIIHILIAVKDQKAKPVKTHNDNALQSLWTALGLSFFILAFLSFRISIDMFPLVILFYGIGTFVTGRIIQFKPLIFGGISCFVLSILITYIDGAERLLIVALSVVLAYIIPAILLKREFNNQQK